MAISLESKCTSVYGNDETRYVVVPRTEYDLLLRDKVQIGTVLEMKLQAHGSYVSGLDSFLDSVLRQRGMMA